MSAVGRAGWPAPREFLVVGAYALALHGAPRYTGDIDVFVKPTLENAGRLLVALSALGFPATGLEPEAVVDRSRVIQMGVEPVQIHVMSEISGVSSDEAWSGRATARCRSHDLAFIGRGEFIRNNQAAGRLKDLADVEALDG